MKLNFVRKFSTKISLVTFLLLMVTSFFVMLYLSNAMKITILDGTAEITYDNLDNAYTDLKYHINSKVTICELLSQDPNLTQFLSKSRYINTNHSIENVDGYKSVISDIKAYQSKDASITSIFVWSKYRKELFFHNAEFESQIDLDTDESPYPWQYNSDKTLLTSAYIDKYSGELIFSIVTPILIDSETVGLVGVNFKPEDFPVQSKTGSFILVDDQLNIIKKTDQTALPNYELSTFDQVLHINLQRSIEEKISYGKLTSSLNDTFYFLFLPDYNWYLLIDDTSSSIFSPLKKALLLTNIMYFAFTIIISLILWTIIKKSLFSLETLHYNIMEVASGNFSSKINTNRSDEIAESIHAFNKMKASLSRLIQNIIRITTTIHDSTSVLADDASQGSNAVDDVSMIIQAVSRDANIQVDETQNALFLSKSIGTKIDHMLDLSSDVSSKISITHEIMNSAHEALEVMVQNAVVSDLSIRTVIKSFESLSDCLSKLIPVQDTLNDMLKFDDLVIQLDPNLKDTHLTLINLIHKSHDYVLKLYQASLEIGLSLDQSEKIASNLDYSIEDVISHCDAAIDSLIDVAEEMDQLMSSIYGVSNRKDAITNSLESILSHSQSTAYSTDKVVFAVESHTHAMKSIEHQISTLYKSSIELSNQISNFKLFNEE